MKKIATVTLITILAAGFTGCGKKSANSKVLECKKELKGIENRLDTGDKNAVNELTVWETKCKKIVKKRGIPKGDLAPNPSDDKNF